MKLALVTTRQQSFSRPRLLPHPSCPLPQETHALPGQSEGLDSCGESFEHRWMQATLDQNSRLPAHNIACSALRTQWLELQVQGTKGVPEPQVVGVGEGAKLPCNHQLFCRQAASATTRSSPSSGRPFFPIAVFCASVGRVASESSPTVDQTIGRLLFRQLRTHRQLSRSRRRAFGRGFAAGSLGPWQNHSFQTCFGNNKVLP
jgi:hypothetical protein